MKLRILLFIGVIVFSIAITAALSTSETASETSEKAAVPISETSEKAEVPASEALEEAKMPTQEEMMQTMMKYATPGDHHKMLEPLIGSWDVISQWWEDPSQSPQESKGTAEVKWIFGGRYIMEELSGEMMDMPFNGMGITGYDNYNGKFISFWADDMSTAFLITTGKCNEEGNIFTFEGSYDDYMTGEKNKAFKNTITIVDENKYIMAMYGFDKEGNEFKSLEATYTRIK